jgi:creatinine amidohydrolase
MSLSTPPWGRYAELHPETLATVRAAAPVAYLPWGALDMHGPHLPLGTDGMIAEEVAARLVQRTGGVLLPTTWWPGATQAHNLALSKEVFYGLCRDVFRALAREGWHVLVVVSGYYAPDHELMLMEVAEAAMQRHGILILALPPLALIDESLLDRAALWETSMVLSLYPTLVDLYTLEESDLLIEGGLVSGRDPRGTASASLGDTVLDLAVERIAKAVHGLLHDNDPAPLRALYDQRRERLRNLKPDQHT